MAVQNNKYEKIWLALIPTIGGIIIAFMTYVYPKYIEISRPDIEEPKKDSIKLLEKAGEVNQISVYNNYYDLYPMLSDGMKAALTKEIFNAANDSMRVYLGDYIKPIDTTQNLMNGNVFYYIRNQYQNGQGVTTVQFDNNDKITLLYFNKIPNK